MYACHYCLHVFTLAFCFPAGAVLVGGGAVVSSFKNVIFDAYCFIGGGAANQAGDSSDNDPSIGSLYATVFGGGRNVASARGATIGGGLQVQATGAASSVAGGAINVASGPHSSILGGGQSSATGTSSAVGPTATASATGAYSTVVAGTGAVASGDYSVAVGRKATSSLTGSIVFADGQSVATTSPASNSFIAQFSGGLSFDTGSLCAGHELNSVGGVGGNVGGGGTTAKPNVAHDDFAVVMGGTGNTAGDSGGSLSSGAYSVVFGGDENAAYGLKSVVVGGQNNDATGEGSVSFGGRANQAQQLRSAVSGGESTIASGTFSTALGGRAVVASGNYGTARGQEAVVSGMYGIAIGHSMSASGESAVAVGEGGRSSGNFSAAVGKNSSASQTAASAVGGEGPIASGAYAAALGGQSSLASGLYSSVLGGSGGVAIGQHSSAIGGRQRQASGAFSMVLGGDSQTASASHSTVFGRSLNASHAHSGSLIIGDYTSNADDQAVVHAIGGVRLLGNVVQLGSESNATVSLAVESSVAADTAGASLLLSPAKGTDTGKGGDLFLDGGDGVGGDGIVRLGSEGARGVRIGASSDFSGGGNVFDTHLFGKLVVHGEMEVVSVQNLSVSEVFEEKVSVSSDLVFQEQVRVPALLGMNASDTSTAGDQSGSLSVDAAVTGSEKVLSIGAQAALGVEIGSSGKMTTIGGPTVLSKPVQCSGGIDAPVTLRININNAGGNASFQVNSATVMQMTATETTLSGTLVQQQGIASVGGVLQYVGTAEDFHGVASLGVSGGAGGVAGSLAADFVAVGWGSSSVNASRGTLFGAENSFVSGEGATVFGGAGHGASGASAVIVGGSGHSASGAFASVFGGSGSMASGSYSAVVGGASAAANGTHGIALGNGATARAGSLTIGPVTPGEAVMNAFSASAAGGAAFFSSSNSSSGVELFSGSGSWSTLSTKEAKRGLAAIDYDRVSRTLAEGVPVYYWTYRTEEGAPPHMGPISEVRR